MSVFVTVGTTKFDALVSAVDDTRCRALLHRLGHDSMTVQIGLGRVVPRESSVGGSTPAVRHFRHEPLRRCPKLDEVDPNQACL